MPEPIGERAKAASNAAAGAVTARVRSSSFKYYIHDSTDALRLKLIGEFTQADVTELNGCWRTARTTIGKRKLVLDLNTLVAVDEAGKQWLASMSAEGACYVPEDYLLTCVAGQHAAVDEPAGERRTGLWRRITSLFGSAKLASAKSSTQEP
jgi:hypothetical protein